MPAIDSLLGILQMKKADGLMLTTGEIPELLSGAERIKLTMPPLENSLMELLLGDLLSADQRSEVARLQLLETTHHSPSHGEFAVKIRLSAGLTTITLRRVAAAPLRPVVPPPRPPRGLSAVPFEPKPKEVLRRDVATTHEAASTPAQVEFASLSHTPSVDGDENDGDLTIAKAIAQAIAQHASDLIVSADKSPRIRVGRRLVELDLPSSSSAAIEHYFLKSLTADKRRQFEQSGSVDLSIGGQDGTASRFRVNLFRQFAGTSAAMRRISTDIPTLATLNLPANLARLAAFPHGLVLLSGPTGSGKSSTIAALIQQINRSRSCHVITLEDPIETIHPSERALVHQREIGLHASDFASGLRAALRENPDVIVVGEMRDPETIRMALTAAETGHLVLSTIHSASAVMAIDRIVDAFESSSRVQIRTQLAAVLKMLIVQQLLPSASGGLLPVLEVLAVTYAAAAQIREGRGHMLQTQMDLEADEGSITMERSLADLVRSGKITRASAYDAAANREALESLLGERQNRR